MNTTTAAELKPSTIRPGLLVSLKTSVRGNVRYTRQDIEADHVTEDGERRARWETERTVADAAEHESAIKARSRCITLVRRICAQSSFGLLCPEAKEAELRAAIVEAREVADTFNAGAALTTVSVYIVTGRVARDDEEAIRAINSDVRDLLADMEEGIRRLDVETIRRAARDAKNLESALAPEAAAKVQSAIDAARAVARKIVAAGETAVGEVDQITLAKLAQARTAFLDLDDAAPVAAPEETARGLDLMPQDQDLFTVPAPVAPAIEI